MSVHKCKFNEGTFGAHSTYLVVFKVHGADAINLWPTKYQNIESIANVNTCHHVHNHDEFYVPSSVEQKSRQDYPQSSSPLSSLGGSISSLITISNLSVNNLSLDGPADSALSLNSTDEDYVTDTDNECTDNATVDVQVEDDEPTDKLPMVNSHVVDQESIIAITVEEPQDGKEQAIKAPEIHYHFRHAGHNDEHHDIDPQVINHATNYAEIQYIVLEQPAHHITKCAFEEQSSKGIVFNPNDFAMLKTQPVSSSQRASFAVDISVSKHEGLDDFQKVGTAYIYLDPKFSSQGIQRTPIIGSRNHIPIGQIQIEYLIVTNPHGYGVKIPVPKWLNIKGMKAGHRGAGSGRRLDLPGHILENTIASFNYAHRNGAQLCELDVVFSADGVPVVYHDFDVDAVTAQQSSDSLGKFRVQVSELTIKQLREFSLLSLHDSNGYFTLNIPNQTEDNRPFPTLAEVLDRVDQSCGLSIEVKWPQILESGNPEARKCREINDSIDRIINVLNRHAKNRRVVVESFDADVVTMLRLKQARFPVFFLHQGMTDRYERYLDPRARSIRNGIYFSQAIDITGIDLILDYYYISGKKLVNFIHSHGLIARGWGVLEKKSSCALKFLECIGLQSITYDKIDTI